MDAPHTLTMYCARWRAFSVEAFGLQDFSNYTSMKVCLQFSVTPFLVPSMMVFCPLAPSIVQRGFLLIAQGVAFAEAPRIPRTSAGLKNSGLQLRQTLPSKRCLHHARWPGLYSIAQKPLISSVPLLSCVENMIVKHLLESRQL